MRLATGYVPKGSSNISNLITIAMEACSSAHYWGRAFEAMGHKVLLVPAQHVTPFVRGGKSDARDALAICEAAERPGLHPAPIKSIGQQDIQLLHRLRQRQVQVRTTGQCLVRASATPVRYWWPDPTHGHQQERRSVFTYLDDSWCQSGFQGRFDITGIEVHPVP